MRTNDTGKTLFQDGIAVFGVKEGQALRSEYNCHSDAIVMAQKLRQEGKQDVNVEQLRSGEEVTRGLCLLGDPGFNVNVVVEGVFSAADREQKIAEGYVETYPWPDKS